jgi:hypothetical protein
VQKRIKIALAVIIIAVFAAGFAFARRDSNTFAGKVTAMTNCHENIGSSGCTWTVGKRNVSWSWGSALSNNNAARLEGFGVRDNIIGKKVQVHGEKTGANNYSLIRPEDYIKLVN